ncbi:MAG: Uma2 family endonuclease [Anaerolineae bacterium]|nr:Uma2 family endonuclease [Anaerolineae bacterium]
MVLREQQMLVSADDFWEFIQNLPAHDPGHYELIEGVIVPMPPTGEMHGSSAFSLTIHVGNHVIANDLGRVTAAETGYIVWRSPDPQGKDIILAPDLGFIAKARMSAKPSRGFVEGAPDLAVEVLSPSDRMANVMKKVQLYLQHGTRLVWVVDPDAEMIVQFTPSGVVRVFGADETLEGGDVLPGFSLPLRILFNRDESESHEPDQPTA